MLLEILVIGAVSFHSDPVELDRALPRERVALSRVAQAGRLRPLAAAQSASERRRFRRAGNRYRVKS